MQTTIQGSGSIFDGYSPPAGFYDEFLNASGTPREAWMPLVEGLQAVGSDALGRRVERLRKIVQENGIAYNVYGDPDGTARTWMTDLLPLIVDHGEWQGLEHALRQRVELLNLILKDLYGPQDLLKGGLLPSELVFSNPAFLRPLHGFVPQGERYLQVYAADLARSPDGSWWVLSDRLEAASGLGYMLENRFISTRLSPDLLRRVSVQRLQPFFQRLCESFESLALRNRDNPHIVLLTSGPGHETYFEQSYLARNLGYPLVEGADLTVRDNRVYLKTLSGIQPVDVIIRRVNSAFCDPLELREDSRLGVAGLVNAVRAGNVAVVNSLGAGLAETPALMAFLPGLCENLLGEPLSMPSVATWWGGQPDACEYVCNNLPDLVVKPCYRSGKGESIFCANLPAEEQEQLKADIRGNPSAYCGQEMVAQATTPVYDASGVQARHFLMRVFLYWHNGQYEMMPGALTRIAGAHQPYSVSLQHGGQSKDTWVLAGEYTPPEEEPAPAAHAGEVSIIRSTADLPSRVADNFFWLGRYVERAESLTRVLRLLLNTLSEETDETEHTAVIPLYQNLLPRGKLAPLRTPELARLKMRSVEKALADLIWNRDNPRSLSFACHNLNRTAFAIKERLSVDIWQVLGRLREYFEGREPDGTSVLDDDTMNLLDQILLIFAAFNGMKSENMTQGHGWQFLDLGLRVERALALSSLTKTSLAGKHEQDEARLQNLLICADSILTYRRRYLTHLNVVPVLDLLLLDESNPRSIAFQAKVIRQHIESLPHNSGGDPATYLDKLALRIYSKAGLADPSVLGEADNDGRRKALSRFLNNLEKDLLELSDSLARVYFVHGEAEPHSAARYENTEASDNL